MKINKLINNTSKSVVTVILLIIACMSMNNFYKMTVGLVASNFEWGVFRLSIMVSYFLPIVAFLLYFCNYYVKKFNKLANIISSFVISVISILTLIGVFTNIDVYMQNHSLGVYGAMPSLLGGFPIDAIIISVVLLISQGYNILLVIKPDSKLKVIKEQMYSLDCFKINIFEYLFLSIVALLVFFFTGDFFSGLLMIENAIYDPKFIYILLWLLLASMGNMLVYVFKYENKLQTKKSKIIYLASVILINVLLVVLYVILGKAYPNYIPSIAKPLFPIAFSKSIPIEMMLLFGLQALAVVVFLVKVIIVLIKKEKVKA